MEPAYAREAFKTIADELARIRSNDPTLADEFTRAKHHVLAHALAMPVAASQRASVLEGVVEEGGDADQLDTQIRAIRGVELAAVQQLAASAMQPTRMIAAVRGDRGAVEAALDALGVAKATIEWIAAPKPDGHELRPAEMRKVAGQDPTVPRTVTK
ncbi:MAG: hypothetical protein ABI591_19535 [Kofleriaceae bacterium]